MYSTASHARSKYASPLGNAISYAPNQYQSHGPVYTQAHPAQFPHENNGGSADNLLQGLSNMNIRVADVTGAGRLKENMMPANIVNLNGMYGNQASGQLFYPLPDGGCFLPGMNGAAANYHHYPAYGMPSMQSAPLQPAAYNGFPASTAQHMPSTPINQAWIPSQHVPRDVPGLAAPRRNSWSSSEETGPHTPLYAVPNQAGYQPTVMFSDQSPNTWGTTPSPDHIDPSYAAQFVGKDREGNYVPMNFAAIVQQEPAIPQAVPAPRTPNDGRGTLDKIFDNPHKTTNVYIRGLQPDTTDAMLEAYGARFGDIVTAKSIIDHPTALCKGYGFIMYHNYVDAENCIRGFYHRGYEAKFAKPSHNSRLKTLARPDNTNLYVSNLPKSMTDAELSAVFTAVNPEFKVVSQKVLKDLLGVSRGVGFARFETPEICEKVIASLHGKPIGEGKDSALLQLRYADTKEQKQLKTETAERRQFKADEYNLAAFGPQSPYRFHSPAAVFPSPLQPGYYFGHSSLIPGAKIRISAPPAPALNRQASHVKIECPTTDNTTKDPVTDDVTTPNTPTALSESEDENSLNRRVSEVTDAALSPTKSKL